jgi:uncharacterized membrane protein YkvA (DUF1232 family)
MKSVQNLMLVTKALKDNSLPNWVKAVAILGVVYVLSPVDIVPDLLPVLGWIDDLGVALLVLKQIISSAQKLAPKPILVRSE